MPRGRWDLSGPGMEQVSPALQGRFFALQRPRSHWTTREIILYPGEEEKVFKSNNTIFYQEYANVRTLFLEVSTGERSLESNLALSCKAVNVHIL